jgi:hypothetical protein
MAAGESAPDSIALGGEGTDVDPCSVWMIAIGALVFFGTIAE